MLFLFPVNNVIVYRDNEGHDYFCLLKERCPLKHILFIRNNVPIGMNMLLKGLSFMARKIFLPWPER